MATRDFEVLIVGAGPVGLTLATALARYGVKFRIVDKATGPHDYSQALVIWPRTQEALDLLGVHELWVPNADTLRTLAIHAMGRHVSTVDLDGVSSPHPHPMLVGQNVTERIFLEHLVQAGIHVDRQVEFVALQQDDQGVEATLRHPDGRAETVSADWMVGCDGGQGAVARALGLTYEGERYEGYEFLMVDCHVRSAYTMAPDRAFMWLEETSACLCFPVGKTGRQRLILWRPDQDPQNRTAPSLDEMTDAIQTIVKVPMDLFDPAWLTRWRGQHRKATSYRKGRAFVAGDAAHTHLPVGGQGMNTGIQDAFNLAWKLAMVCHEQAPSALLDSYDAEREPVGGDVVQFSDRAFKMAKEVKGPLKFAMRWVMPGLLSHGEVQSKIRDRVTEETVAYPHGPLSEDHGGSRGPAAGYQAPDAMVTRWPEGTATRLYDLFRELGPDGGPTWTLLLFCGPDGGSLDDARQIASTMIARWGNAVQAYPLLGDFSAQGQQPGTLFDLPRYAFDAYGVSGSALFLVRPDGYIGFRSSFAGQQRLIAYLDRILATPRVTPDPVMTGAGM